MTTKRWITSRVGAAAAGIVLVVAGTTVVLASGNDVQTIPPYGSGYQFPPNSYDVSGGPVSVTFEYTIKNLTGSAISVTAPLDVSRIVSVELSGVWTDVSTGYPAIDDSHWPRRPATERPTRSSTSSPRRRPSRSRRRGRCRSRTRSRCPSAATTRWTVRSPR